MKKTTYIILLVGLGIVVLSGNALAGTATVSWNAPTTDQGGGLLTGLAGYKIYYGTSPRSGACPTGGYPNVLNVGNVTTYTFSNLTDGYTYYFSVTAYDTSSPANESVCSAEVSKPLPATSYITNLNFTPSLEGAGASGKTFTITIYQGTTQVAQFSIQPTAGQIPLPIGTNLLPGTYNITADAQYYLRARQNNISLASNSTAALSILKAGDLNNDGIINSLDWSAMNSNWWSNSYPSDINQDGVVNSVDFSWMNKNWLLSDA